jgi:hypothetical protein
LIVVLRFLRGFAGLDFPFLAFTAVDPRHMVRFKTVGIRYGALRKECLEAVRLWPGCETVAGIQIIRDNRPAGFSVRVTLYGHADVKTADRAMICVQREKRRQYHLME